MSDAESGLAFTAPMLGQVLLRWGKITIQELDGALAMQAITGERLGETLVQAGALSEMDLEHALEYMTNYSGR